MDSKVYEYVVALADTGSYAKAAAQLYITPQGLSSSIKRLESTLGVPLFRSDHEGTTLTSYGRTFYDFAKRSVRDYGQMVEKIERMRHQEERRISLSTSPGLFNNLPRESILEFNEVSETGATVVISRTLYDQDCVAALREKLCDFVLLNDPIDRSAFAAVPICREMMLLWTPEDSELASRESVSSADLAGMDLVCLSPKEYVASVEFAERLAQPPFSCTLHFADEVIEELEIAMERKISAIVPRVHATSFTKEGFVGVPITDITWGFSLAYLADRELSPWDEEFISFMSGKAQFWC